MGKRDIKDVNENKKWFGRYTAFLAGDILQFKGELEYKKANQDIKTPTGEEIRWTLVPIVSIFESFYKEIFARYIDFGEPYLSRAKELEIKEKRFEISSLIEISKKSFTTGELIAYSLSYNSFNQIRRNYKILCGIDFLHKILDAKVQLDAGDIIEFDRAKKDISNILSSMESIFHFRHALVHEYPATNVSISIDQALTLLDHAWLLLMATDRIFWADTGLDPPIKSFPIVK